MDKNVTVSVKGLLLTGLVLLALAVAYLLGQSGGTTPAAQAAEEVGAAAAPRTLTMRGSGEAVAVPDQVAFDLSVRMMRPSLEEALDEANAATEQVLTAIERFGVERKDVQTTGLEMYPVYDYPDDAPPVLRGYRVVQQAAVLVTELKRAGGAVSAAVAAGGNAVRVQDIRLRIGDPEAALAEAREDAVAKATAKAEEYAAATGQELGEVMTLVEVDDGAQSSVDGRDLAADGLRQLAYPADSSVPVRAGRADLGVTVQVVWALAG